MSHLGNLDQWFDGRSAVVTGGAGGMGRAIALGLGERGWDLALHYLHSSEAAHETAERLRDRLLGPILDRAGRFQLERGGR